MKPQQMIALLAFLGVIGCGSNSGPNANLPVSARVAQTKQQVPDSEILGLYCQGDGLGFNQNLVLKKDHKFSYNLHGCLGTYDQVEGSWTREGDLIVCKRTDDKPINYPNALHTRFFIVREKNRQYLIEENSMPAFAAMVGKHKSLPGRHGFDYVLVDPKDFSVMPCNGPSVMPKAYSDFYRNGEIEAKVTKLRPDGKVILDRGSGSRLRPGLLLTVNAFSSLELKVLSVTDKQAVAEPIYSNRSDEAVSVGMEFTSGSTYLRVAPSSAKRFSKIPPKSVEETQD